MIGLVQRVSEARVDVGGRTIGAIGPGMMVLVCAERDDTVAEAVRLLARLLDCRVFADAAGKMNLSLRDVAGGLLLVPQFTLAADTARGTRPSFSSAAPPEVGRPLFDHLLARARLLYSPVAAGEFGATMKVSLTNDGPVTLWLQVSPRSGRPGKAGATE
ncbi:MAG: D-aminoacyl-tRNA deacylase [Betaproteobacteria bacterium]